MKIFLSLRHPFGLRNFEPVVRQLAELGHSVHISFLTGDKQDEVGQAALLAEELAGCTYSKLPSRKHEAWLALTRWLRLQADALRYRLPMYDGAEKLQARAFRRLTPRQQRFTARVVWRWGPANRLATAIVSAADRLLPPSEILLAEIRRYDPDLIVVSPLVDFGSDQVEAVKAGRELGIRTALAVNSWDNLTNKGLIRIQPDRIFVWNESQRQEAIEYHGARPASVEATGAPIYDRWFDRQPSRSEQELKLQTGLDVEHPYFLYLCSSPFIAPDEMEFVGRWLVALRESAHASLRTAGVLIRPHPENRQPWRRMEADALPGVVIWPPSGASPVNDKTADDYFDSIFHSRAVVGINSSGLIEAGIAGRPVLTLLDREFESTQHGTIHFRYLVQVGGGLLRVAHTWREHEAHLLETLTADPLRSQRNEGFLREFVRPHGLGEAATPRLASAIAELAGRPRPTPNKPGVGARLARRALMPLAQSLSNSGVRTRPPEVTTEPNPIEAQIALLARSVDERVILGPWLYGPSLELVYWLPFLAWVSGRLRPERLIAVSRGGVAGWYQAIAADFFDVLDYLTTSELAAALGKQAVDAGVPRGSSHLDRETIRMVKQAFGTRRVRVLHPSILYEIDRDHWSSGSASPALERYRAIEPPEPGTAASEPGRVPTSTKSFIAVGSPGPGAMGGRDELLSGVEGQLAQRGAEVRHVYDSGADSEPPSDVVGTTRMLASAAAYVGLGSDYDLVPAQLGVPSLLLRSPDAGDLGRIEHANRLATVRGGARIEVCDPRGTGLAACLSSLGNSSADRE